MNQKTTIPAGISPLIHIESVTEDVRIKGNDQTEIVIHMDDEQAIAYDIDETSVAAEKASGDAKDNSNSVQADETSNGANQIIKIGPLDGDCIFEVPMNASLRIGQIGGDAQIRSVRGDVAIDAVGEDLSANKIGSIEIGTVGSDLSVKRATGDVTVDSVGEDAFCLEIDGNVQLQAGGDLALQTLKGNLNANVGEDATLRLALTNNQKYNVIAGGDVTCYLPDDTSAKILLRSGNRTLRVRGWDVPPPPEDELYTFTIGEGEAELNLNAGEDISLVSASVDGVKKPWIDYDIDLDFGPGFQFSFDSDSGFNPEQFSNFFSEKVQTKVQNAMRQAEEQIASALSHAESRIANAEQRAAEFESRWSGGGKGRGRRGNGAPKDRPGVDRRRREARHERRHQERRRKRGVDAAVDIANGEAVNGGNSGGASSRATGKAPVTEAERLMVLRMVEQGKISVEQAEKLLSAMSS